MKFNKSLTVLLLMFQKKKNHMIGLYKYYKYHCIAICNERSPFISLEDLTKLSCCRIL